MILTCVDYVSLYIAANDLAVVRNTCTDRIACSKSMQEDGIDASGSNCGMGLDVDFLRTFIVNVRPK